MSACCWHWLHEAASFPDRGRSEAREQPTVSSLSPTVVTSAAETPSGGSPQLHNLEKKNKSNKQTAGVRLVFVTLLDIYRLFGERRLEVKTESGAG